jgi:hypothetical protein
MNPSEKGWLKEYLEFRKPHPIKLSGHHLKSRDSLLYKIIQPTGLIYGHPIHAPGLKHPKEQRWNSLGKMKIVLLESFFHSALLTSKQHPSTADEWDNFYEQTTQSIGNFYCHINPELLKKRLFYFKKVKTTDLRYTEKVLQRKLFLKTRWDSLWVSLFKNSLLFLDTFYFGEWKVGRTQNVKKHKDGMKMMLLKIIAAATHANHILKNQQKNVFFDFLDSYNLSKTQTKLLKEAFRDQITVDDIDLHLADTWLLKRFVLELTILMIWADKVVADEERLFLIKLAKKLGLKEIDLDISLISIESFVIANWKEVYFLQNKHSYQVITQMIQQRLVSILSNYKVKLINEIKLTQNLSELLEKWKYETLNEEEKEQTGTLLRKVLFTIPIFRITKIPDSFLQFPQIMKILPKDI